MHKLISVATLLSSLLSVPVMAGEAYVENTDIYTNSTSVTRLDIRGRTDFQGIAESFSFGFKVEEFDRDSNVDQGDRFIDIDQGFAGSVAGRRQTESYDGFSSYTGFQRIDAENSEYTHRVTGGTN